MTRDCLHLLRIQHRGLAAEGRLDLAVVESGVAAGHDQQRALADT
jgi:hypothetical protein